MRHFAEDALPDGEVVVDASELPATLPLPLEYRRPLYLVFKEAVNNVARHAKATRIDIRVAAHDGVLELVVQDNGCGFDQSAVRRGEGLMNVRRRIRDLSGTATWETTPGKGTRLTAKVPLSTRRVLPKLGGARAGRRG
jgi:signal transduction histidine kinase